MQKDRLYFNRLYKRFNKRALVSPDPLQFVYGYPALPDREIAALLCACLAYGNVKQIIKNLNFLFAAMPNGPYHFITRQDCKDWQKALAGFKYRFTTLEELCGLLGNIKKLIQQFDSLENCFLQGYHRQDETLLPALYAFAKRLREPAELTSLVPNPDKKSPLKRLNLFLRWMVRQDEVDPGGWTHISPAQLIVPLDVHMHRLGLLLGLTRRHSADMNTALEITRSLARFSPQDPVKYDFCLTRFGIRDDMHYADLAGARL